MQPTASLYQCADIIDVLIIFSTMEDPLDVSVVYNADIDLHDWYKKLARLHALDWFY